MNTCWVNWWGRRVNKLVWAVSPSCELASGGAVLPTPACPAYPGLDVASRILWKRSLPRSQREETLKPKKNRKHIVAAAGEFPLHPCLYFLGYFRRHYRWHLNFVSWWSLEMRLFLHTAPSRSVVTTCFCAKWRVLRNRVRAFTGLSLQIVYCVILITHYIWTVSFP